MGFYETLYLIRAFEFVPGVEGVTSRNIRKINGRWYYYVEHDSRSVQLEYIPNYYSINKIDLADIMSAICIKENKNYELGKIEEDCSLKGMDLEWYILSIKGSTLEVGDTSLYYRIIALSNVHNLKVDYETVQKFKSGVFQKQPEQKSSCVIS